MVDEVGKIIDKTVPDGTQYLAGGHFTKTWTIWNAGQSTWDSDVLLVPVDGVGRQMMARTGDVLPLETQVAPGRSVDVPVDLHAPMLPGKHRGYFQLARRIPGVPMVTAFRGFGKKFFVEIHVPAEDQVYDVRLGRACLGKNFQKVTQTYNVYYEHGPVGEGKTGGWHPGIDFRAPVGWPVYTPVGGVVAKLSKDYGYVSIKIRGSDYRFFLAHLDSFTVGVKDTLEPGDQVGISGMKGTSAAHLHVELRKADSMSWYFKTGNDTGVNIDPGKVLMDAQFAVARQASRVSLRTPR